MITSDIKKLVDQTEEWRLFYKRRFHSAETKGLRHGAAIEAAACAIRLTALNECLKIAEKKTRLLVKVNTPPGHQQN